LGLAIINFGIETLKKILLEPIRFVPKKMPKNHASKKIANESETDIFELDSILKK
jgi:hypothetical protein